MDSRYAAGPAAAGVGHPPQHDVWVEEMKAASVVGVVIKFSTFPPQDKWSANDLEGNKHVPSQFRLGAYVEDRNAYVSGITVSC